MMADDYKIVLIRLKFFFKVFENNGNQTAGDEKDSLIPQLMYN